MAGPTSPQCSCGHVSWEEDSVGSGERCSLVSSVAQAGRPSLRTLALSEVPTPTLTPHRNEPLASPSLVLLPRSCLRTWLPRPRNCLLADVNLPREANISGFGRSGPELREDGGSMGVSPGLAPGEQFREKYTDSSRTEES